MRELTPKREYSASAIALAVGRLTAVLVLFFCLPSSPAYADVGVLLNESLAEQISAKLVRMDGFRAKLAGDAERCRELLAELD